MVAPCCSRWRGTDAVTTQFSLLRKAQCGHSDLMVHRLSCDPGLWNSALPCYHAPAGRMASSGRLLVTVWDWRQLVLVHKCDCIYAPPQVSPATLLTSYTLFPHLGFLPVTLCWGWGRAWDPRSRCRGPGTPWRSVANQSLGKYPRGRMPFALSSLYTQHP